MKKVILITICGAILLLADCFAILAWLLSPPVPRVFLQVAPGTPAERVFDCAEQRLEQFQAPPRNSSFWKHPVTVRDISNGIFETGNFPDTNVMGFRVQIYYRQKYGAIRVNLKGVGIYLMDLGSDDALKDFEQGFRACLSALH